MDSKKIPEQARQLSMEYTLYHTITIDEEINLNEVKQWWVKYGILFIEMNDGKIYQQEAEANWEQINWKRGHRNLVWQDEDYNEVALRCRQE